MRVQLAKWGNSTGFRIPSAMLEQLGLRQGSQVELSVDDQELRVRPLRKTSRQLLEEMVAEARRLGPEHETPLLDWGPDRGSEIIDDAYSRGEITPDDIPPSPADDGR